MPTPPPQQTAPRQQGNVLLLVLVVLGLLALLGGAYLQTARVQRQVFTEAEDNTPLVLDSIIDLIETTLRNDIYDPDTGNFFDIADGTEPYDRAWTDATRNRPVLGIDGTPIANMAVGGMLDDPWLSSTVPTVGGGNVVWPQITSLTGGMYDVEGTATPPTERRVVSTAAGANPAEVDLADINNVNAFTDDDLVDADADGVPDSRFERAPIAVIDGVEYFMAVKIVDLSSLLNINAALSSVGTTPDSFDTSTIGANAPRGDSPSDLNLGQFAYQASSLGDDATATDVSLLQRLRFNNLVGLPMPLPIPLNPLVDWNAGPLAPTATAPTGGGPSFLRETFGLFANSQYGNFNAAFNNLSLRTDIERELRFRNGALDFTDAIPNVEDAADGLFASHVTTTPTGFDTAALAEDFFTFGSSTTPAGAAESGNVRRQLTTRSAEALYAPPIPGQPLNGYATFKIPLNGTSNNNLLSSLQETYEAVFDNNTPPASEFPPSNDNMLENQEVGGARFAAAVVDYRDEDNIISRTDVPGVGGTQTIGGLEALPFISEVYVQREYTAAADGVRGDAAITPTPVAVTWNAVDAATAPTLPGSPNPIQLRPRTDAGYAIEIRNPFNRPVSLENVWLEIFDSVPDPNLRYVIDNDETDGVEDDLDEIAGAALATANGGVDGRADDMRTSADESRMLYPDQTLIVYRNSGTGGLGANDNIDTELLAGGSSPNIVTVEISRATGTRWPIPTPAADVPGGSTVQQEQPNPLLVLMTTTQPGGSTPNGFVYAAAEAFSLPDQYNEPASNQFDTSLANTGPTPVTAADQGFLQLYSSGFSSTGANGDPDGINMLAIQSSDFENQLDLDAAAPNETTLSPPRAVKDDGDSLQNDFPSIGDTPKRSLATIPDANLINRGTLRTAQILIADRPDERIRAVGELLHIAMLGPRIETPAGGTNSTFFTIADEWDTDNPAAELDRLYLNPAVNLAGGAVPSPDFPNVAGLRVAVSPPNGSPVDVLHASLLLSQVSTLSVAADGRDSDGDGTDDQMIQQAPGVQVSAEQTVTGRLNINTVDPALLASALPIALPLARTQIATLVANERDTPTRGYTNTPSGSRGQGIVNLWEYWVDFARGPGGLLPGLTAGNDGMDTQGTGARTDFSQNSFMAPDPSSPPATGIEDDVADDREERTSVLSYVDNVTTNRSDTFVAYILIQGYRDANTDGDFDDVALDGEGLVEQARAIVLFDRTQLYRATDAVQSEILFEFPQ